MVTHRGGDPLCVRGHRIVELCRHGLSPVDNVAAASPLAGVLRLNHSRNRGILVKQISTRLIVRFFSSRQSGLLKIFKRSIVRVI